ncbi:MAG: ligase-associated DNA damage response endonuclease PdeM [Cyclobacteriaceae bacterium]
MTDYTFELQGEQLKLSPDKSIYWEKESLLIVSDIHLGKAGHFRKSGVAVPAHIHFGDLARLTALIRKYSPDEVAFLGDLFHSDYNLDWDYFCEWREGFPDIRFILVKGNHDILYKIDYINAGLELTDELIREPFSFSHEKIRSELYNISGHVHPAVKLRGMARQGVSLPCFYFSKMHALMPAFGSFTGFVSLSPYRSDNVFVIAENQIIPV